MQTSHAGLNNVGVTFIAQKDDEGSKLVIKAMSDRSEKNTGLMRDILRSILDKMNEVNGKMVIMDGKMDVIDGKMDEVKQLIIDYTEPIEQILGKVDNLEGFLKEKLSSDFEKIRYIWEEFSAGKIKRRDLIKECIKILGRKFIGLFISNLAFKI